MTRQFADDQELLAWALDGVIREAEGEAALELHQRAVDFAMRARSGDTEAADMLAELVGGMSLEVLQVLIRSLTCWFALGNLAEDNERVRRQRAHEVRDAPAPRRGSPREAIDRLARRGTGAAEFEQLLARAEVRLVMTAHPTEARRRTTVEKLARVFAVLRQLDERHALPGDLEAAVRTAGGGRPGAVDVGRDQSGLADGARRGPHRSRVLHLDARRRRAEVLPRARGRGRGLVPRPEVRGVPPLLSFGSWIGGDRDGNPNVTPEVTAEALEHHARRLPALPPGSARQPRFADLGLQSRDRRGLSPCAAAA